MQVLSWISSTSSGMFGESGGKVVSEVLFSADVSFPIVPNFKGLL